MVTVLFVDLVGFTAASESRDPEDVKSLLDAYVTLATRVVGRYGGVLEKFIGDAVMAVWGVPAGHDDDAVRAIRAALELVSGVADLAVPGWPAGVQARAGVLTGETAVDLRAQGQGMVTGDIVNTAARLQSVAAPGTVLVGQGTRDATGDAIEFSPDGPHQVKGKTLPIPAWRAVRATGRRREASLEPPFVGREHELRQLTEALHAVAEGSRARLVSITGVAGIGKSRLVRELQRYAAGLPEVVHWLEGRCPAYGEGVTFWALSEMVRMRLGLRQDADAETARAAVDRVVRDLFVDAEDRQWVRESLEVLLGVAPATATARSDQHAAWRRFFEAVATDGPTVLVVEDLHAADEGMLTFLEQLLGWSPRAPVLVLTLSRPELDDRHPGWATAVRNATFLHLEPLSAPAMRALLTGLAPQLPTELSAAVLARSEGVPLYAVEFVRSLLPDLPDTSVVRTGLELPTTLSALVGSRIDALPDDERRVLRVSSVLGQTFHLDTLVHLLARPAAEVTRLLERLTLRDIVLVHTDPRSTERGQYGFVQGLLPEVAYAMLSRRDRRALHLGAARWFSDGQDPALASVVAHHYVAAVEADPWAEDAHALTTRASEALLVAAERAEALGALPQAVDLVEEAIGFTTDKEAAAALHLRAAELAWPAGHHERTIQHATVALQTYESLDRPDETANAAALLGVGMTSAGRSEVVGELIDAFRRLTDRAAPEAMARLSSVIAFVYMLDGDELDAVRWADCSLSLAGPVDAVESIVTGLTVQGSAYVRMRRAREGAALALAAAQLAEQYGTVWVRLMAAVNAVDACMLLDPVRALELGAPTVELARRHGQRFFETAAGMNAAWAALQTGRWDVARDVIVAVADGPASEEDRLVLLSTTLVDLLTGAVEPAAARTAAAGALAAGPPALEDEGWRNVEAMAAALDGQPPPHRWWQGKPVGLAERITAHLLVGHLALWQQDLGVARDQADAVGELDAIGAYADLGVRCLRAGLLALTDEVAAAAEYDTLVTAYRSSGLEFHLALALAGRGLLLRDDAAASEAAAVLEGQGAAPFLRALARSHPDPAPRRG